MFDLHVSDFYKDTARILLTLYRRFPVKSALYVEDICGPDTPDEFGLHSPRHMACFSAMLWLAEENYLRFSQTIQQEAIDEAVLTQACFTHFSALDDATSPQRQTRVSRLSAILENKSTLTLDSYVLEQMQTFPQKRCTK